MFAKIRLSGKDSRCRGKTLIHNLRNNIPRAAVSLEAHADTLFRHESNYRY